MTSLNGARVQGDFMDEIAEYICKEWSEVRVVRAVTVAARCSPNVLVHVQVSADDIKTVDKEKK